MRLLVHDSGPLLVAEHDNRIVGTLIATWDGWRGGMWRLAVHPDHRRRGIARALVATAEQRLRTVGATRIATFVVTTDDTPNRLLDGLRLPAPDSSASLRQEPRFTQA